MKKRKKITQKIYNDFMKFKFDGKNPFNKKSLEVAKLNYWKIVKPEFPYDRVLKTHFILVPLEEKKYFCDLSIEAQNEFFCFRYKPEVLKKYVGDIDYFLVNNEKNMTVKCIFHAHIGNRKWWYHYPITLLFE